MEIDLKKIVDGVWEANSLYSNTYKDAALTCMKSLLQKMNERQQPENQQQKTTPEQLDIAGVGSSVLLPKGFKIYKCTDCQEINIKKDNREITVGYCDNCGHPLWNDDVD